MKAEKSHGPSSRPSPDKPQFNGSVEIIPLCPTFIEFITTHRLWGLRQDQLEYFILGENPEQDGTANSPTDMLMLTFETQIICLFGWRLELMLDPLMQGRVKRVHAEEYPGTLIVDEPWVSKIKKVPRYKDNPL